MKKLLTIGFTIAGCLLAVYFLWTPTAVEDNTQEEEPHQEAFLPFSKELAAANQIEIEKATAGSLKQKVEAPAQITIISDQEAHIHPKISGIALAAYANLGDIVAAGEIVAQLESKEIAEAKANYLTALKKELFSVSSFEEKKNSKRATFLLPKTSMVQKMPWEKLRSPQCSPNKNFSPSA